MRGIALIAGAAGGGGLVGSAVQWLARWSLLALVGVEMKTGGGVEGLIIGASAALATRSAPRTSKAVWQHREVDNDFGLPP
jgi:hypothetical protein